MREQQTRAWCDQCRQYQPTLQKRRLCGLPYILNINSSLYKREDRIYWRGSTAADQNYRLLPKRYVINSMDFHMAQIDESLQCYIDCLLDSRRMMNWMCWT
jgi:hypothetical protein